MNNARATTAPTPADAPTRVDGGQAPSLLPGLALAAVAALVAVGINRLVPTVSALLIAILLGIVVANTVRVPVAAETGITFASKKVLRAGIVLLGLGLSLRDIAGLGAGVIAVVVAVVAAGFATAELLGRRLGLRPAQRLLIGSGMSICGAAAVAAVDGAIDDREDEDTVTAVALVVVFGTLMIPLVPALGCLLDLDAVTNGLWAGASIHEVAQVVAAGGIIGAAALKGAVVIKLARVLMLAPVIALIGLSYRRRGAATGGARPPIVPLFVIGFVLACLVRTAGVLPDPVLSIAAVVQTFLLAAAMFGLGCGVKVATLRAVGGRPVVLAAVTTLVVLGVGLGGVVLAA